MAIDKSHMEPAHPMVVALHDSLVAIYKLIREKYQAKIDAAFDEVSRQVGFVVTTTVPAEVEVGDGNKIKAVTVPEALKGTLFEKIAGAVGKDAAGGKVAAGKYNVYLIWYPALKLRLRTDFMEPAHFRGAGAFASQPQVSAAAKFVPGVREPAHWFDAGVALAGEEAISIAAIDEAYPELRLAERVSTARQAGRGILGPGIQEPAHFGPGVREPAHFGPGVREPAHFGPGVREPAHFQQPDIARQFAQELAALMKRFGM